MVAIVRFQNRHAKNRFEKLKWRIKLSDGVSNYRGFTLHQDRASAVGLQLPVLFLARRARSDRSAY